MYLRCTQLCVHVACSCAHVAVPTGSAQDRPLCVYTSFFWLHMISYSFYTSYLLSCHFDGKTLFSSLDELEFT